MGCVRKANGGQLAGHGDYRMQSGRIFILVVNRELKIVAFMLVALLPTGNII